MIRVELARIIIDEKNHDQAVVLREKDGGRLIPIMIGFVEASSIQMCIAGVTTPRPMTHDLLSAVIKALEAEVEHLFIDGFLEGTFFAKLCLKNREGAQVLIDCRPSDGIALSVRMNIPIFIENKIFAQVLGSDA